MIQDIGPHRYSVEYAPCTPAPEDRVLVFDGNNTLLGPEGGWPAAGMIGDLLSALPSKRSLTECLQYLFVIDDTRYFLYMQPDTAAVFGAAAGFGLQAVPVKSLRGMRPMVDAFAGYTGSHLHRWYSQNRFCGRCGTPMEPGTDERKLVCPSCHNLVYPRIDPCIIAAVYDGDRLLMTRYAGRIVSWYVLVAGFIEIGETAEETVRREVMEETGVEVTDIRYFGSQPWGIPGNLTLGYTAKLSGSDRITVDHSELSDARWFNREDVPVPNDDVSITAAMIRAFKEGKF